MANTKASLKDIRQIEKRTAQNKQVRTRLKTLSRRVREAREAGETEKARTIAREYVAVSDRAAKTNVIHPNKAARHKAACADLVG